LLGIIAVASRSCVYSA